MTNSPAPFFRPRGVVVIGASTSLEKLECAAQDCVPCGREAVKSVLRLFDELVKCDEEGVLKGVREVVEGK